MENGQDLVTMCCHAYESPDTTEEDEEMVDYCKCHAAVLAVQPHQLAGTAHYRKACRQHHACGRIGNAFCATGR
jgi:hypothetical protein